MALDVELAEIRDFLARHAPFDDLPRSVLDTLPREFEIEYHRRGAAIMSRGSNNHHLWMIRSGAVDMFDPQGDLADRGTEGTCFGTITLVHGNPSQWEIRAIEDTLVYKLPAETFYALGRSHPAFAAFFDEQRAHRMEGALASQQLSATGSAILKTHVRDLLGRQPVTAPVSATIAEAAGVMSEHGVSSLLLLEDGRLVGILTDRDLRNRVVATGVDPNSPVTDVMTAHPVTGSVDALAFEVLLEMTDRAIHHLPILDQGRPLGVVTTTDLMRLEHANPVYLVGDIAKQHDVAGVAAAVGRLPRVVAGLVSQDASAHDIGRVVTAVGDAVERRLLLLAEEQLGPPPVPYCWVTLGSRARHEQALATDQDNALIVDDSADLTPGTSAAAYFDALSHRVSNWLVECGYPLCDGDVMASNPEWRQTLSQWKDDFRGWLTEPTPEAVLRGSIFFDMRAVHGEEKLASALTAYVRHQAPSARVFLAHLAKQATLNEPPLGFFRGFVVAKEGEHKDALDIKRGGIGSVVELARVHALSLGSPAVDTRERIEDAIAKGVISAEKGGDLLDAFEFISYLRLRHQTEQVQAGHRPDNFVAPDALTAAEKRHLREAFGIVRSAQGVMAHLYPMQYIS